MEGLIDPNHALYTTYFEGGPANWHDWNDREDDLNIIDADHFMTNWPMDATWTLERVPE